MNEKEPKPRIFIYDTYWRHQLKGKKLKDFKSVEEEQKLLKEQKKIK